MPMWTAFFIIFVGWGGACLIVVLGIPLSYFIFWIINKCGKSYPKWLKHVISICLPIVIASLWATVITYAVKTDGYRDRCYTLDGVEIPVKVTSVEYPPEKMVGDNYQEIKHFDVRGGLSPEIISQLETLCLCDTSHWLKDGTRYVYFRPPMDDEWRLEVTIDSVTNTGTYDFFKF